MIVLMAAARKIAQGTPDEVWVDPGVIALRPDEDGYTAKAPATSAGTADEVFASMLATDRLAHARTSGPVVRTGDVVLRAEKCVGRLWWHTCIGGLDFDIRRGEVVALLGANRAGKTTTVLTLAGEL